MEVIYIVETESPKLVTLFSGLEPGLGYLVAGMVANSGSVNVRGDGFLLVSMMDLVLRYWIGQDDEHLITTSQYSLLGDNLNSTFSLASGSKIQDIPCVSHKSVLSHYFFLQLQFSKSRNQDHLDQLALTLHHWILKKSVAGDPQRSLPL